MKVQTSMKIIYLYGGGLAILTILMILSWGVNWYHSGVDCRIGSLEISSRL